MDPVARNSSSDENKNETICKTILFVGHQSKKTVKQTNKQCKSEIKRLVQKK